ncbi:MAG: CoA pyrophosphatase [Actinomycetota bacterium]|nr:CoA pyrophosphatase [Actinomycetota bacterium]
MFDRSGNRSFMQRVNRPNGVQPAKTLEWISKSRLVEGVPVSLIKQVMASHVPIVLPPGRNSPNLPHQAELRPNASILIPIFDQDGMANMILTRRSSSLRTHAGEVAFPGGKVEEGETIEQAAVREAYEEIGLDPAGIKIEGRLVSSSTMSSFMSLVAVVATLPKPVSYRLNSSEVERVFSFPISYLFQDGVHSVELWPLSDEGQFEMHFFDFGDDLVWGATARIIYEFMRTISQAAMAR